MGFNPLVANPGRLEILAALAAEDRQAPVEFVRLRERTRLTDGNLACHARRLQSAGLVAVDKRFRDGKPVTRFVLTPVGRAALEDHVERLLAVVRSQPQTKSEAARPEPVGSPAAETAEEAWID